MELLKKIGILSLILVVFGQVIYGGHEYSHDNSPLEVCHTQQSENSITDSNDDNYNDDTLAHTVGHTPRQRNLYYYSPLIEFLRQMNTCLIWQPPKV
jgi:hypothetical protein